MTALENIHPGQVLVTEFLQPNKIPFRRLAQEIKYSESVLISIGKGKRRITAEVALRLGKYFGNSPKFWLGLQHDYDLEVAQSKFR